MCWWEPLYFSFVSSLSFPNLSPSPPMGICFQIWTIQAVTMSLRLRVSQFSWYVYLCDLWKDHVCCLVDGLVGAGYLFTSQLLPQLPLRNALLGKMSDPSLLDLAVRRVLAYWARKRKRWIINKNISFSAFKQILNPTSTLQFWVTQIKRREKKDHLIILSQEKDNSMHFIMRVLCGVSLILVKPFLS